MTQNVQQIFRLHFA